MPTPALPHPRGPIQGSATYRRTYSDVLGRALSGFVIVYPTQRVHSGAHVVPAGSKTRVDLVAGVLVLDVPPGSYTLEAHCRTIDGHPVLDKDVVTVE